MKFPIRTISGSEIEGYKIDKQDELLDRIFLRNHFDGTSTEYRFSDRFQGVIEIGTIEELVDFVKDQPDLRGRGIIISKFYDVMVIEIYDDYIE